MSIDITSSVTTLSERVAEEIRALLARRRVRQAQLARQLEVSEQWISVRLRGVQPIDLNDLEKIAEALGVSVADLMPRTVVHAASPGVQTTVPKSEPTHWPHLFGHPERTVPASSTRRTARVALAYA